MKQKQKQRNAKMLSENDFIKVLFDFVTNTASCGAPWFSVVKAVSEVAYGIVKMAAETSLEEQDVPMEESTPSKEPGVQKMFTLKKWNAVAMWSWDVECDTCAICRVQVMGQFLLSN